MKGKNKKEDLEQYHNITVADMNIEGMPWYRKKTETDHVTDLSSGEKAPIEWSPKETRRFILYSVGAALLVGGVFFLGLFLFLLFCVNVWL